MIKKARSGAKRGSTSTKGLKCGNPSGKRPALEIESGVFDAEAFALCVSQIELAARQHSPSQAMAVLSRFLQESGVRESLTIDSPISFLQTESRPVGSEGLDVREINMLEREGFMSVRAFVEADKRDLEAIPYFGVSTIERMERIRSSVRKEIIGLSPKLSTRRAAAERALRGDLN